MELRRVLFVCNPARPAAATAAERGRDWCAQHGISSHLHGQGEVPDEVDLVVAVGGDGTLLRAAGLVYPREVPILGVNAGGLGFLAACDAGGIGEALDKVRGGKGTVERRARLLAAGPGVLGTALNEAAFVGPDGERFTELEVELGGERAARIEGDGLIVATPTGSTAYALAAGGPLLTPSVPAFVLVPLAPHRLGARPLVVSQEAEVAVRARCPARLLLDGDPVGDLEVGAEVRVRRAPAATLLVRMAGPETYFARLRDRLGWPA